MLSLSLRYLPGPSPLFPRRLESLSNLVVCATKGPRPRYPRVWKTKTRIGTASKSAKLVHCVKGLSNVKEEVYGVLDSFIAWDLEFPLITVKKALKTLENQQEWKRIIQVIKWMLSKGQGRTMGTYFTLLNALAEDGRLDEVDELWTKLFSDNLESMPRIFFNKMIAIYYKRDMYDKIFEVPDMDDTKKPETHMTSAAAFVKGGIQDSCDDACSICLEDFCESDPSTVTNCRHEFHLQCILEWCQRSSHCPMCLRAIGLKDTTSQELLEAVEHERKLRAAPPRNAAIFHHPTLGEFELQHLPVGATDTDLEERIIQHLAAAAAMGRTRHFGRREGQRNRSSPHGRPHFLVFSTHPGAPSPGHVSSSLTQVGGETQPAVVTVASPSTTQRPGRDEHSQQTLQFPSILTDQSASAHGSTVIPASRQGISYDRAGPSELQSFSDSLKSRLNAVSLRYKESLSRSTRGWKERLFSRNSSMSDIGSEVRREVNAGIATVSRMMERLETRDSDGENQAPISNHLTSRSVSERSNQNNADTHIERPFNEGGAPASFAASSAPT